MSLTRHLFTTGSNRVGQDSDETRRSPRGRFTPQWQDTFLGEQRSLPPPAVGDFELLDDLRGVAGREDTGRQFSLDD
jgi:hypothetical protein